MTDVLNKSDHDSYIDISTNALDTILLLHIITKYEIDKPIIDWKIVQENLNKEYNRLKDLKVISPNNSLIDSLKSEEDTKTFYNNIQDVFSKNHVNLQLFLTNKRKELIKLEIEKLNKELKEKYDNIQLIKSNYLEQLQKEQSNERDDKDQQKEEQSENELVEVKDEDQQQKEKSTTTITSTPKSKRKHSALSTPQQTKDELEDEQIQKKKEDEQQKASNIKKILSGSLTKVWKTINSNRHAYIFRYPISKEDAPDYDTVIKHRMDLTTLKKKLDDNVYNNCSEFNKDLLLIFKNAMIYNEEDSDIYNAAVAMKKSAEKEMEACFATEELLNSGAGNSLGTRSNRGPMSASSSSVSTTSSSNLTTSNLSSSLNSLSSTAANSNTSAPSTPSLSTTVATMPSPSIRGRNKTNANSTPISTTTTRSSSKKNSESDQSNPNTPSLQEDSIDFSDDNNPTTPRSNKSISLNTPTSTSRSRSSAKKQAEAEAESNSKKVSKRQRNSKIDETITHQDD